MKAKCNHLVCGFGVVLLLVVPVAAQQVSGTFYTNLSAETLKTVLQKLGYPGEIYQEGVYIRMGDKRVYVQSYLKGTVVVASCNDFPAATLEVINKWNDEMSHSRAILRRGDKGSYSRLESDLDCETGVSERHLGHYLMHFQESIETFGRFLEKNRGTVK